MKDTLIAIIGQYVLNDTAEGIAQIDFVWIFSAILLCLCVYSVFKLIALCFSSSMNK